MFTGLTKTLFAHYSLSVKDDLDKYEKVINFKFMQGEDGT